jgi:hypothetical protein
VCAFRPTVVGRGFGGRDPSFRSRLQDVGAAHWGSDRGRIAPAADPGSDTVRALAQSRGRTIAKRDAHASKGFETIDSTDHAIRDSFLYWLTQVFSNYVPIVFPRYSLSRYRSLACRVHDDKRTSKNQDEQLANDNMRLYTPPKAGHA